jgi:hypothetical protein
MKKRMKKDEERRLENTKKLSHAVKPNPVGTPSNPVRSLNGPGRCCLILCAHLQAMCAQDMCMGSFK